MNDFLITYDLRSPGQDYDSLQRKLRALDARKILESVWLTRPGESAGQLLDGLLAHLDDNDRFLVIRLATGREKHTVATRADLAAKTCSTRFRPSARRLRERRPSGDARDDDHHEAAVAAATGGATTSSRERARAGQPKAAPLNRTCGARLHNDPSQFLQTPPARCRESPYGRPDGARVVHHPVFYEHPYVSVDLLLRIAWAVIWIDATVAGTIEGLHHLKNLPVQFRVPSHHFLLGTPDISPTPQIRQHPADRADGESRRWTVWPAIGPPVNG